MLENPNDLRMPISPEYLEGREAYRAGKTWLDACPFAELRERLDYHVGLHDEAEGVPVEERAEVETSEATA